MQIEPLIHHIFWHVTKRSFAAMSVPVYQTTQCHFSEGLNLYIHHCQNLKSHKVLTVTFYSDKLTTDPRVISALFLRQCVMAAAIQF